MRYICAFEYIVCQKYICEIFTSVENIFATNFVFLTARSLHKFSQFSRSESFFCPRANKIKLNVTQWRMRSSKPRESRLSAIFLPRLTANLSNRLAILALSTHGKFLFQAASPDNGHCPRDRVARTHVCIYISRVCYEGEGRGGGVFDGGGLRGGQVKSGGEKEGGLKERGSILLRSNPT